MICRGEKTYYCAKSRLMELILVSLMTATSSVVRKYELCMINRMGSRISNRIHICCSTFSYNLILLLSVNILIALLVIYWVSQLQSMFNSGGYLALGCFPAQSKSTIRTVVSLTRTFWGRTSPCT